MSTVDCKMMLAKALYDNVAETPDELAFRRGDIMTVLAQDTDGLEGWWLCCLRGRKGIAPFNRLKLLEGLYGDEGGGGCPGNRRSLVLNPNKVVTPQKVGSVYIYNQGTQDEQQPQDYDVPQPRYFPGDSKTLPNGRENLPLPEIPTQETRDTYPVDEPCYNVPKSNRSSTVSMLSTGSNNTVSSSNSHSNLRVGSASPRGGRSARSSAEVPVQEDLYDIPPLHPKSTISEQTPLEIVETYDTPSNVKAEIEMREGIGSKKLSRVESTPMDFYDVPSKLKGQVSLDSSILDVYDLPPSKSDSSYNLPALPEKSRVSSVSCAFYDTPSKLGTSLDKSLDKSCTEEDDDYDIPKPDSSRSSGDSGIDTSKLEMLYDLPPTKESSEPVDNDETYDTPTSNSATFKSALAKFEQKEEEEEVSRRSIEAGGVYDVPPQVTRDSTPAVSTVLTVEEIPSRVSTVSTISTCSTDSRGSDAPSVPYDELPLNRDSALETLVKLQQDSEKACSHLLGFVNSTWRTPENLEPKLFSIKLATLAVKTALQELVDFGQGTLANCAIVQDKKLVKKLFKHLEPLQTSLLDIKDAMQKLNNKWDLGTLSSADGRAEGDDLSLIVNEAKDMPSKVTTLASLIQGNATLLFKKVDSTPAPPSTHNVVMRKPLTSTPKKPPPPPVKPKPKLNKTPSQPESTTCTTTTTQESIQSRPLPGVPPSSSGDAECLYDVPKPSKQSTDCDKTSDEFDQDYDYVDLTQDAVVEPKDSTSVVEPKDTSSIVEARDTSRAESVLSLSKADDSLNQSDIRDTKRDSACSAFSEFSMSELDNGLVPPKVRTSGLSPRFKERLEMLQVEAQEQVHVHTEEGSVQHRQSRLHENDKQILGFYSSQVDTHSSVLVNAIDAFFQCVDYNQPPRVFIAHSKFVILGAHKMVYIADTITRYTYSEEVRSKITACANMLCDCLKSAVTATKQAALQYPAVGSSQAMVDKVVDVSHAANALKMVIVQAAQL